MTTHTNSHPAGETAQDARVAKRRDSIDCAHCGHRISRVIRSRPQGVVIRRERRCAKCRRLFIAYELSARLLRSLGIDLEVLVGRLATCGTASAES